MSETRSDSWGWCGALGGAMVVVAIALASFPERALAQEGADQPITFSRDVAPILQAKCQTCHRPGGMGPTSWTSYEEVRPFAALIKEKVVNRRMPPWYIEPGIGIQDFKNDISLSDEEIETITRWVDSGAPLGDPAATPAPRKFEALSDVWQFESIFGRPPDLIIQNPPFKLHAKGLDQWPKLEAPLEGLDEERYMFAIEAQPATPESRYVFHHGGPSLDQDGERTGLMNSPAGKVGEILPTDSGKLVKPGATIRYSLHLFPIGQEIDVVMNWGLWFYPKGENAKNPDGIVFMLSLDGSDRKKLSEIIS